jgi:hypothetical protein
MDAQDFLKQYAHKKRKFPWVNLAKVDLTDAQIPQVNLSRSDLTEVILIRANLSGSNLIKAILRDANLQDADLTGVNFHKADLTGAILEGAILEDANLTGVNLDDVYLNGAIMPDGKPYEEWILQENPCLNPSLEFFNEENREIQEEENKPYKTNFARASLPIFSGFGKKKLPRVDLSDLKITDTEFLKNLPLIPVGFLTAGYIFYGMILFNFQGSIFLWLMAWIGSLIWYIDETLILFVPMTGLIASLSSVYFTTFVIVLSFINFILLFPGLLLMGFSKKRALLDGILGTGFFLVTTLFTASLVSNNSFDDEALTVLFGTLTFPFALLMGVICSTLGSTLWIPMELAGFTKRQTLQSFAIITGIGLIIGGFFELLS